MTDACVQYTVEGSIARVALDRPTAFNAMDVGLARGLGRAFEQAGDDDAVRCLVITGIGKAFCAGGDVLGFHGAGEDAPSLVGEILGHLHPAIGRLLALDKPVIAAVNGPTAGAGMGLMMAADLAIASEAANFTMAYTAIAASPDGASTWFLPRIVGLRRALELTLTNRRLSAAEALDWGLVNAVVGAGDLEAAVDKQARALASGPTRAFGQARRLLHASFHTTAVEQLAQEAEGIVRMAATADFREGVGAFVERRKPAFRGD